jgi:dipeptidyl aminopeptidase/acylaminoacyl peptidase
MPRHLSLSLFALVPVLTLAGCSGSSLTPSGGALTEQTFGSLTTRAVGTVAPPVTSSAAFGANVTGIAGALIDRLTLNFKGPETSVASKIAFYSSREGNYEIYTMNPNGTGVTRLTTSSGANYAPVWSADGTRLAFFSYRDGNNEIYTMNADGTNQTRLTNNTEAEGSCCWSPDGSKIAFSSYRDGGSEIYVMNADGTNQTRLVGSPVDDYGPSWSPDGSKIAFFSNRDGANEIYTMNTDGSNQTRLTNNADDDSYPVWSPDGSKIVFYSLRDGNYEIYTMNADGTGQTNRSNNPANDYYPSWSPDGSKIVFNSTRDGNFEIYTMNADGSSPARLTNNPADDVSPAWFGSTSTSLAPKTLIGPGGTLGTTAAGFLFGQKASVPKSVLTFDTTSSSRSSARVATQSAPFNDQGTDLIFSITTSAALGSVNYVNISASGVLGSAVSLAIPSGSTGAIVSFVASSGAVGTVIPYAANRSAGPKQSQGEGTVTYTGSFGAIFDGEGKNLAQSGASSVTLDTKSGKLLRFE